MNEVTRIEVMQKTAVLVLAMARAASGSERARHVAFVAGIDHELHSMAYSKDDAVREAARAACDVILNTDGYELIEEEGR